MFFFNEYEWEVYVLSHTHRTGRFLVCDKRHSSPAFWVSSFILLADITKRSKISPAGLRIRYADNSLESTETAFFRLEKFVPDFRPKCSINGVFFGYEWAIDRRTFNSLFRLSHRFCFSSKFAFIKAAFIGFDYFQYTLNIHVIS